MCVEIRKCPFFDDLLNRTAIPRPRSVIKLIRENQCGFSGNTPYVCCQKPSPETSTEPHRTVPTSTTKRLVVLDEATEPYDQDISQDNFGSLIRSHPNFRLLSNDICGPIATDSRITSGSKATLNEYPWMALIAYDVGELRVLIF